MEKLKYHSIYFILCNLNNYISHELWNWTKIQPTFTNKVWVIFSKWPRSLECFKQIYCSLLTGLEMYADLLLVYRAMLCCCWIQTTVPFADFCSRQMIRSLRRERLGGSARRRRWGVTPASVITVFFGNQNSVLEKLLQDCFAFTVCGGTST